MGRVLQVCFRQKSLGQIGFVVRDDKTGWKGAALVQAAPVRDDPAEWKGIALVSTLPSEKALQTSLAIYIKKRERL